jgi:CHASE2 domain-containing sensor protein
MEFAAFSNRWFHLWSQWWSYGWDWLRRLGGRYQVNPVLFASLYLGAIPFTIASVAWAARNHRLGRPNWLPIGLACLSFSSATLYVLIAGRNLPLEAYVVLGLVLAYGLWAVRRSLRKKTGGAHPAGRI